MAVSQCETKFGRAMGLEHVHDKIGHGIRKYDAARVHRDGRLSVILDGYNAEQLLMEIATANRRNHILGECRQLKVDVDSYRELKRPGEPIQIELKFNIDLEELALLDDAA